MAGAATAAEARSPGCLDLPLPRRARNLGAPARCAHGPARRARDGRAVARRWYQRGVPHGDLRAMSLLLSDEALRVRTPVAHTELAPLADSLARELAPVLERPLFIPSEKALLSREGGRCPRDGVMLDFDPFSPQRHRCPVCGEVYTGEFHYRFWIYWYQLWLIERALHGALFAALDVADPAGSFTAHDAASFASTVLARYADQYSRYPNRDNVLGPTRVFF